MKLQLRLGGRRRLRIGSKALMRNGSDLPCILRAPQCRPHLPTTTWIGDQALNRGLFSIARGAAAGVVVFSSALIREWAVYLVTLPLQVATVQKSNRTAAEEKAAAAASSALDCMEVKNATHRSRLPPAPPQLPLLPRDIIFGYCNFFASISCFIGCCCCCVYCVPAIR